MLGFIEGKRCIAAWCEGDSRFRVIDMADLATVQVLVEHYAPDRRRLIKQWRAEDVRPCNSQGEVC
jgi:hypothetical protein